jgi:hypothetical protein
MGSTVFRILPTDTQNPQAPPSGFYISVFSILNPVDPLASVSNLYLLYVYSCSIPYPLVLHSYEASNTLVQ